MPQSLRLYAAVVLALGLSASACSNMAMPTMPSPARQTTTELPPPAPPAPTPAPTPSTARYEVVFDSTWSRESHPTDFPDDAHYSGLIGGTHAASVVFWREGALASEGIRRMAERGSKSPLDQEVNDAIAAGAAQFLLSGGNLGTTPGTVRLEFEVSQTHPLVSLVTMVAPSPDWFVGVDGLALFENGAWVSERRVDLHAFDAGTDSGVSYKSPDQETLPHRPIARLTGYPVAANGGVAPFGTFTFRRIQ
jgi:spondin N